MNPTQGQRLLFIINPGSGTGKTDWSKEIRNYFTNLDESIKLYELPKECKKEDVKEIIASFKPDRIIAVGGDGTVRLVALSVIGTDLPMGILPAGSANAMTKELQIPADPQASIDVAVNGKIKMIHALKVNDRLSIHLSDIGFNAYVVKKFLSYKKRGMLSYLKAAWKVVWNQPRMTVMITTDSGKIRRHAIMVVIANGTRYGSGAIINPEGKLNDDVFEVIVIKRVSFIQSFNMLALHKPYDPRNSETIRTTKVILETKSQHFQVDGEYLGRTKRVVAEIIPQSIHVIVPDEKKDK
jgi:diacylglycerol kinase (ATP)